MQERSSQMVFIVWQDKVGVETSLAGFTQSFRSVIALFGIYIFLTFSGVMLNMRIEGETDQKTAFISTGLQC